MPVLSILTIAWLLFVAYWWISAMGVKKNVRRRSLQREVGIRILALAVIVVLVRFPGSRAFLARASAAVNSTEAGAGLILCLAGFVLAVWARLHLGRNWGMPMTFKEGHDLVTGGPYRYIRHPIYTPFTRECCWHSSDRLSSPARSGWRFSWEWRSTVCTAPGRKKAS